MKNKYPNEVTFVAACAVEADYIYVASYVDKYDPEEYSFTRLYAYLGRLVGHKWYHHDLNSTIVSVCVKRATASMERRLCALSKEGEVEIFWNKDGSATLEQIPGAGLDSGDRGYVTAIREIGGSLFVCGMNNQVYRRDEGKWNLITSAPLQMTQALQPGYGFLNSIDGSSENDVYTCGLDGKLFHYDGVRWTQIKLSTDEHLNCVRCISADEVWVCGHNGTVLKGNAKIGFSDQSSVDDNFTFWSLAKFRGNVYLATADEGLFYFDGKRICRVVTGLESELWTYNVDATPEVLWSFGPKEIAFFDGTSWTRLNHPENPPT